MTVINNEMVTLAREFRGITQEELAREIGASQAKIARIEGGLLPDLPDSTVGLLCNALRFPLEFFTQNESRIGFGSSAYFYRRKADLTAADRKRIHGLVNILRINIKSYTSFLEIEAKKPLPTFELSEFGDSPTKIAQAVRGLWKLPDGPIKNLTTLIESAGVIIVPVDFGTRAMDATSLRLAEMPPLIFINTHIPGDRWRFTLAHELAHLIMHDIPDEKMEDQADEFAAEFLMPEVELRAQLSRYRKLRLVDLANLKYFWKTSMGSLIERARDLDVLDQNQHRYLWMTMSKLGHRTNEPNPIAREEPKLFKKMVEYFLDELKYSAEDLRKLLKLNPPELELLHGVSSSGDFVDHDRRLLLRVVQ